MAFYSSHGEQIAVAAPGGDTRVDLNGDGLPDGVLQDTIAQGDPTQHGYFPFQGTSMATPHVAGVAALIMSTGVTDPDAVREIIMSSSEKRSDQLKYGAGVLDGGQAVAEPSESESTFAGLFVLLFGFAAMRFKKYGVAQVPTYGGLLVLTFWVSGAFSWISSGWFSSPFTLPLHLFGPEFHLHPFLVNSLWVVVPTLLCWGIKGARVPLAGFAMGAGAFFLAQAYLGYVDLSVIVGHGMADALWLTFNGLISLSLGLFVWRNAHFKR